MVFPSLSSAFSAMNCLHHIAVRVYERLDKLLQSKRHSKGERAGSWGSVSDQEFAASTGSKMAKLALKSGNVAGRQLPGTAWEGIWRK